MKPIAYDSAGNEKISINVLTANTDWQEFTPVIDAVTSNPTKGTVRVEKCFWRREGSDLLINFYYSHTSAGAAGNAGSGIYLFKLPASLTIDTNIFRVGINSNSSTRPGVCGHGLLVDPDGHFISEVRAYDSTSLILFSITDTLNGAGNTFTGSSSSPLSRSDITYSFNARLPILGWSTGDAVLHDGAPATREEIIGEVANGKHISPDKAKFIPGAAKAWATFSATGGSPTLTSSYNVSSISDDGQGLFTVNFNTAFSNSNYVMGGAARVSDNATKAAHLCLRTQTVSTKTVSSCPIQVTYGDTQGNADAAEVTVVFFGEQ